MANYRVIAIMAVVALVAAAFAGVAMSLSQDNVSDAQEMSLGDRIVTSGMGKDIDVCECLEQIKALEAEFEQKIAELEDEKAERKHAIVEEHQEIYDSLYRKHDDSTAIHANYAEKAVTLAEKIRIARQAGKDVTELQKELEKCKADLAAIKELIKRDMENIAAENERYEGELRALEEEFSKRAWELEDFYDAKIDEIWNKMKEMFEEDVAVALPTVSRQAPAPVYPAKAGEALASVPFGKEYNGPVVLDQIEHFISGHHFTSVAKAGDLPFGKEYNGPVVLDQIEHFISGHHFTSVAMAGLEEISSGELLINSTIPGKEVGSIYGTAPGFIGQPQMNFQF